MFTNWSGKRNPETYSLDLLFNSIDLLDDHKTVIGNQESKMSQCLVEQKLQMKFQESKASARGDIDLLILESENHDLKQEREQLVQSLGVWRDGAENGNVS